MLRKVEPGMANVCMLNWHKMVKYEQTRKYLAEKMMARLQNVCQNIGGDDCVVVIVVVFAQNGAEPFGLLEISWHT